MEPTFYIPKPSWLKNHLGVDGSSYTFWIKKYQVFLPELLCPLAHIEPNLEYTAWRNCSKLSLENTWHWLVKQFLAGIILSISIYPGHIAGNTKKLKISSNLMTITPCILGLWVLCLFCSSASGKQHLLLCNMKLITTLSFTGSLWPAVKANLGLYCRNSGW